MNIIANELKLPKQNMKFGEASPQPTAPVAEPPVAKPGTGMNALHAQGLNNQLSFQGGVNLAALKKKGLQAMMALTLLGGAAMTQSCSKYLEPSHIYIEHGSDTDITIIYDDSKWQAMFEKMMEMWQMMLEQQQITNDQLTQLSQYMLQMMQMMQEGQLTAEQFYAQMYEFMMNNENNQSIIIDLLIENGKTQEEANELIQSLIEQVQMGQISAAEAMEKIMEALGDIGSTLDGILEQLKNISEELTQFHNDYNEGKEQTLGLLGDIYEQGTINTQILLSLNDHLAQTSKNLQELQVSVNEIKDIVSDDTKFNELMEQLKKLEPETIDYQKFEDMFKLLGFTLTDVINMSKDELLNAIKNFENTYIENEENQNELLQNINVSLNIVINFPGLDQTGVIDAIKELTETVNNGNTDVINELKDIQNQLDKIQMSIDNMMTQFEDQASKVNQYLESFNKQFSQALEMLTDLSGDMEDLKFQQSIANSYLNNLIKQVDELTIIINEIKDATENGGNGDGSSITIEELENLLKNYGDSVFNRYEELIKNLGIEFGNSTATIEDLLKQINEKMDNQKDYTEQLATIISMLEGIDLTSPDYSDKLDRIIELLENFKCNCNCGANSGDNEGIIGDLEDILG